MADFQTISSIPDTTSMDQNEAQFDAAWEVVRASLPSNNNELVLPAQMGAHLSSEFIEKLKARLSQYLGGAPTIAFVDYEAHVFRICRVPQLWKMEASPGSYASPSISPNSPRPSALDREHVTVPKTRTQVRKKAPPRPPNSFILYRQKHHPLLKAQRPGMPNNDISVILGKQWKAESESVKAQFKALADKIKAQHTAENPGYQYAPRKPSEKKRRMTARKMAQAQAAHHQQVFPDDSAFEMHDFASYEEGEPDLSISVEQLSGDNAPRQRDTASLSAQDILGTRRPATVDHLRLSDGGRLVIGRPSSNPQSEQEITAHNDQIHPNIIKSFEPAENSSLNTQLAPHVTSDQEFFESLVYWESINEDAEFLKSATAEELAGLADVEFGSPFLSLSQETQ